MRKKLMENHADPELRDEPTILSMDGAVQANTRPDDNPPAPTNGNGPKAEEGFWAGRNLAMRRSARWAA